MAPFDSESSADEDDEYTETNVLLGYASKEPSDDTISQLGGRPTWLDPSTPPSATLAKCKVCSDLMVLLLQLNGDLPEIFPGHERRLYVLTCRRKTCRRKNGSVRAVRGVRITLAPKDKWKENAKTESKADVPASKTTVNIGNSIFGTEPSSSTIPGNPFSVNSAGKALSNPFVPSPSSASNNIFVATGLPATDLVAKVPQHPGGSTNLPESFASALSLNKGPSEFCPAPPPELWPQDSEFPTSYPLHYLVDANYEILDKVEDPPMTNQTMDLDEGPEGSNQKEDKDVYESTIDKTFQKFADRLAQNSEQVIRYEFMGQPLLYSKHDDVGKLLAGPRKNNAKVTTVSVNGNRIPRCSNCGSGRAFEVQLTPHAIMELEREETSIDGMEWGTIIVGVCERDCQQRGIDDGGVGYVEEWVGVQWEEIK